MGHAAGGGVTVLTGASSGIGEALAYEFARRGHKLGLIARREDKLAKLAAATHARYRVADVADRAGLIAAVHALRDELGPIDLIVANAGVGTTSTVAAPDFDAQYRLLTTNLFGVVTCVEAVLPDMLARKHGRIAAVASVAGYLGLPGSQAYCASKAGVIAYLNGLRVQLRGTGVGVTTICPGFIKTPMVAHNQTPMPFLRTPQQAARQFADRLAAGDAVVNYPFAMAALVWLARLLPDAALVRVVKGHMIPEQP